MRFLQFFILLLSVLYGPFCFSQNSDSIRISDSNKIKANGRLKPQIPTQVNNRSIKMRESLKMQSNRLFKDSTIRNFKKSIPLFELPRVSKPMIAFNSGKINYATYFRSMIDTPLLQYDIYQHQVNGTASITLANKYPIRVNTQILRSNSIFFRDINDVQVEFDLPSYRQKIYEKVRNDLKHFADLLKDTLSLKASQLKFEEYVKLNESFSGIFSIQKLIEANEILNIPELTWDNNLPDSLARIKSDSIKSEASKYISLYKESTEKVEKIKSISDSLKNVYDKSLAQVKQLQDLANGKINNLYQFRALRNALKAKGGKYLLNVKDSWLLGIRKFSLGRSPVNYSELTAKNISLNGLNFEYNNAWYYFSITAGLIDFRYRDFLLHNANKPKQYFFMGRIGVGSIENNYVILSLFKGKKQVFRSGNISNLSSDVVGASVDAKYRINKNFYFKGEVAESIAPDFRIDPPKNNKWNLKDKTDKAFSISSQLFIPRFKTKVDATYKYTGANYQSFSHFQTNSTLRTWNVKAEQYMFKKHLRITAALKSNDFSNPYIIQSYQTNIVFKSLQAVFRKRGWPMISGGYMPVSQLTNISGNIVENRFNAINSNLYHNYKIGNIKAASSIAYSRFYNTAPDSGFIYFNARNIYANQIFYFKNYTAGINITYSANLNYQLTVMDEHFKISIKNIASLGIGVKINNLNHKFTAIGPYGNFQLNVFKKASLSFSVEDGYIPGNYGTLSKNTILNFQLSKVF